MATHGTGEHVPLRAKMLVAMHQDGCLLGESGPDPVRSLIGLREIRACVDLQVAERSLVIAARETTNEHGPICIGKIDAISGITKNACKAFELRNGDPD